MCIWLYTYICTHSIHVYSYTHTHIYTLYMFIYIHKGKSLSRVRLFATPWTAAHQAPPSMGLSRQKYWGGLPFPSPGGCSRPRDRTRVSHIVGRYISIHTHIYVCVYIMCVYIYVYTHSVYMYICVHVCIHMGFPSGSVVKTLPANAGDTDLIPGSGRSPGEENSNPLQDSCLENSIDRGAWGVTVHGVAKSRSQLSN